MFPEIMEGIFYFLNLRDLLINCSRVSKQWNFISQQSIKHQDLIGNLKSKLLTELYFIQKEKNIVLAKCFDFDSDISEMYLEYKQLQKSLDEKVMKRKNQQQDKLRAFLEENPEMKDPDAFALTVFQGYCVIC